MIGLVGQRGPMQASLFVPRQGQAAKVGNLGVHILVGLAYSVWINSTKKFTEDKDDAKQALDDSSL